MPLLLLPGCGESSSKSPKQQAAAETDPNAEFEWGMQRLDRALRLSRPSTSDGLFTERKMSYEVFKPSGDTDHHTAKVTITTESEFIHGKRKVDKKEASKTDQKNELNYEDPREDKSGEVQELVDFPGVGPKAPKASAPSIEPRSLENQVVFDLAYLDEQWQLQTEPEHTYEQLWFEYAFPEK